MQYYNAFWDRHYTRDKNYYSKTIKSDNKIITPLAGEKKYDVCIIGAGFTGLATAYYLRDSGLKVCILERHEVGWGSSGRNGGQIIPGLAAEIDDVQSKLGYTLAKQLWDYSCEGSQAVFDIIKTHNIECDLVKKYIVTAQGNKEVEHLKKYAELLDSQYNYSATFLDKAETDARMGTDYYDASMAKPEAGHFHPLKYIHGLAKVLRQSKIDIFEHNAAEAINKINGQYYIYTSNGMVEATSVVLAGDSYLGSLVPQLRRKYVLIRNAIIGTMPVSPDLNVLSENDAVCEMSDLLHFYRKGADGSFLFGGGDIVRPKMATTATQEIIIQCLYDNMVKIFPQLKGIETPYYWGGYIGMTSSYMPNVSSIDHNMYYANGYSGHGVNNTHCVGRLLADAIAKDSDEYKIFDAINNMSFPGDGRWDPYLVTMGIWWRELCGKFG